MPRLKMLFKAVYLPFLAFIITSTASAAPNPKVLIEKMAAVYKHAHSIQQVWIANVSLGPQLKIQMHIDNKSEGLKLHILSTLHTTGNTPQSKMIENMGKAEIVSNGVNLYTYHPYNNSYTVTHLEKGAMGARQEKELTSSIGITNVTKVVNGKYKLLKATKIGATPVWVVEVVPAAKPTDHDTYFINKSNDHLKQVIIDSTSPYGGTMKITLTLMKELLNGYLSPSLFQFNPPKNAHLTKGMGMSGMMAGGM